MFRFYYETWERLKEHPGYEINTVYPYRIRNINTGVHVKEFADKDGYVRCWIGDHQYMKHRLIAKQWLKNPYKLPQVDHINRNCCDNHLSNLRWVSNIRNTNNRSNQTFVDCIPKDAIAVKKYNGHTFKDLYFHDDTFYRFNGVSYVVKPKYINPKNGLYRIYATDTAGQEVVIYYTKFLREFAKHN